MTKKSLTQKVPPCFCLLILFLVGSAPAETTAGDLGILACKEIQGNLGQVPSGLDVNPRIRWRVKTKGIPVLVRSHGDTLYCGTTKYLYALDHATGATKWLYRSGRVVAITVAEGMVFSNAKGSGQVTARDAHSGTCRWIFRTEPKVFSRLDFYDGLLHFYCMFECLYALDVRTGRQISKVPIPYRSYRFAGIFQGTAFVILRQGRGTSFPGDLVATDVRTGKEKWRFNIEGGCDEHLWQPPGSPGLVCIRCKHHVSVLDLQTGREVSRPTTEEAKRQSLFNYHDGLEEDFVIAQGIQYDFSEEGQLCAADEKTGDRLWQLRLDDSEYAEILAWVNGLLLVATGGDLDETGFLYAIETNP